MARLFAKSNQASASESHILEECVVYEDIRNEYENINDDTQLASFFATVLKRKDLIDDFDLRASSKKTPRWLESLMFSLSGRRNLVQPIF